VGTESITANGIRFHVEAEGNGPLILLLHGFPQTWYMWKHVMPQLAAAGYRVVAPDLRGVGETSRPKRIRDYRLSVLGDDVAALVGALGAPKAHLIGHDFGGIVAWEAAFTHPEAVDRLIIVNAPPQPAMFRTLLRSPRQLLRSWYLFFFAIPGLPERLLTHRHAEVLVRMFELGQFSDEEIGLYRDAMAGPGAASAGLAWYRAAVRNALADFQRLRAARVDAPTLVIWGEQDPALGTELNDRLERYVRRPLHIEYLPDVGHWVVQDVPERFVTLVTDFLEGSPIVAM
jgi:pimeloyl-ACP methyl ester carboxylesterase